MADSPNLKVGSLVYASVAVPATEDAAGYGALTYTEIGSIEDAGEHGGTATVTNFIPLATGVVDKLKGSIDYGSKEMTMAVIGDDAGQALLAGAFDGANKNSIVSIKVVDQDGNIDYFMVYVTKFARQGGNADSVDMLSVQLAVRSKVITDKFSTVYYAVTYTAGANGSIVGDTSQTVASGNDATAVYAAADATYQFVQWTDASTDNPRTDTAVAATITQTATFALI